MKKIRWRRLLLVLHRDLGFLCVGLTFVYAVSGVAVNHRHDWDYDFAHELTVYEVGAPADVLGLAADDPARAIPGGQLARDHEEALVTALVAATGHEVEPYNVFWRGPDRLSLFFEKADFDVVDYAPSEGTATRERKTERFLLRAMNALHLNHPKGAWTWIADIFAILLLFLAISGAVIVRGRSGLIGRGGVYVLVGVLLPIVVVLLYR